MLSLLRTHYLLICYFVLFFFICTTRFKTKEMLCLKTDEPRYCSLVQGNRWSKTSNLTTTKWKVIHQVCSVHYVMNSGAYTVRQTMPIPINKITEVWVVSYMAKLLPCCVSTLLHRISKILISEIKK